MFPGDEAHRDTAASAARAQGAEHAAAGAAAQAGGSAQEASEEKPQAGAEKQARRREAGEGARARRVGARSAAPGAAAQGAAAAAAQKADRRRRRGAAPWGQPQGLCVHVDHGGRHLRAVGGAAAGGELVPLGLAGRPRVPRLPTRQHARRAARARRRTAHSVQDSREHHVRLGVGAAHRLGLVRRHGEGGHLGEPVHARVQGFHQVARIRALELFGRARFAN